ncbi:YesL family protein [Bifidobacterium aquikefiri]|uniref:YesL family protein n=1 Tax=Bifidobacterium aquikefiri TaxID=1653207 RepID=UPI0039EB6912
MKNIFDEENKVATVFNTALQLLILNILWTVTSLPIITAGASTHAVMQVLERMRRNEEGYVFKSFWSCFSSDFVKATRVWLPLLAVGIVLVCDFIFWNGQHSIVASVFTGVVISLGALWFICFLYTFPLLMRSEKMKGIYRQSILLGIKYLPESIMLLLVFVLVEVLSRLFALMLFLYLMLGMASYLYFVLIVANRVIAKETSHQSSAISRSQGEKGA